VLLPCHIERKSLPTDGQLDLSFYRSMWQSLVTQAPQGDTVVATDPPLTSIVAMAAARRNGAAQCEWALSLPETDARSTREFFDTVEDDRS
jgi:hypothetical protein